MVRSPDNLAGYRGRPITDVVGPRLKLLFVGINPGLWSAAVDAPFARPGNRFWPALALAGIVDHVIDASDGLAAADRAALVDRGVGITNLVSRATARAAELSPTELRAGTTSLAAFVNRHRPRVVAMAGITAYRTAFGRPRAVVGAQPETLAGARLWVVPNPSGLNAHETTASLAAAYREAAAAAGLDPGAPTP